MRSSILAIAIASWCGCSIPSQLEDPASPDAPAETTARTARVVGTGGAGLRMRSGPGEEFEILLVIPEGAAVDVFEDQPEQRRR
jgi:hypothetical protein